MRGGRNEAGEEKGESHERTDSKTDSETVWKIGPLANDWNTEKENDWTTD